MGDIFMSDLPLGDPATFIGECEVMDLTELKDKLFIVAINSGDRGGNKFICETLHGPYNFVDMVEEAASMWKEYLHHPKIYVLNPDRKATPQFLDECTTDYIEAKHVDIITEAFLDGTLETPEYTCRAGLVDGITDGTDKKVPEENKEEA
jgi:hypothetical protein